MAFNINLPQKHERYNNRASFPQTGDAKILYVANDTSTLYTYADSTYTEVDKKLASSWGSLSQAPQPTNSSVSKTDVGLSNVDNTSDANKPVSTATQTALDAKQDTLVSGTNIKTINSTSILGSGDITISGGGLKGIHAIMPLSSGDSITNSINGTNLNGVITGNRLTASPFIPSQNITSSSLYVSCSGAVAGALGRIIIYSDRNGKPFTKLYESANLDLSTTGLKTAVTTFNFVAGEIYWLCYHGNGFTPTMSQLANSNGVLIKSSAGICYNMMFHTVTFGNAPATWTSTSYNSFNIPLVGITKA